MHERHINKEKYFKEQVYTTREFVIPYINACRPVDPEMKVLEIGCGEGGNLVPFLEMGCQVSGVDISPSKIENAMKFLSVQPYRQLPQLLAEDIYKCDGKLNGPFDLIIMRDVIEHIHDQERFMGYVKRFLKPDGMFFLAFPPWYNPFGGHQQVCESRILSKLPYFHLFPAPVYRVILKTFGENNEKIKGLIEIKQTGISIERFRRSAHINGFHIVSETMFLVNPNYFVKFGLKPKKQNRVISGIPFIRNLFSTACYYILKQDNQDPRQKHFPHG